MPRRRRARGLIGPDRHVLPRAAIVAQMKRNLLAEPAIVACTSTPPTANRSDVIGR
jgi:hypothetical protein